MKCMKISQLKISCPISTYEYVYIKGRRPDAIVNRQEYSNMGPRTGIPADSGRVEVLRMGRVRVELLIAVTDQV
jgi:hypothetical protein